MQPIRFVLAGLVLLAALPAVNAQCFLPYDMTTWGQEGRSTSGTWSVQNTYTVVENINGTPTFFVSPDTLCNTTITGTMQVNNSGGDNDFMGFVFGYRSPVSSLGHSSSDYDFLLFDWKRGQQTVGGYPASPGMSLCRVDGDFPDYNNDEVPTFWGHTNTSEFQVLASDWGSGKGWNHNQLYAFKLIYEANRIRIFIDNSLVFDVSGSFQPGRFGFYNYSQPNVHFTATIPHVSLDVADTTHPSCPGYATGSISVSGCGGTKPYSFQWAHGPTARTVSGLGAGTYSVTITDADGCDTARLITITDPPPLQLSTDTTHESCSPGNDGAIDLTVSGGTAPYSYYWSTSATTQDISGLQAGSYSVTVIDAENCQAITSAIVGRGNPSGPPGLWTWAGQYSTDWFEPCNWDKQSVPTITDPVHIPGGTLYQPHVNGGSAQCFSLLIDYTNGGQLTVHNASGGKITVAQ